MTETTTWVGTTGYYITKQDLSILRKMAKAAGTNWKPIVARPALAAAWLECYRNAQSLEGALTQVLERVRRGAMPC